MHHKLSLKKIGVSALFCCPTDMNVNRKEKNIVSCVPVRDKAFFWQTKNNCYPKGKQQNEQVISMHGVFGIIRKKSKF